MTLDLPAFADAYRQALLQRGSSARHAAQQRRAVLAAGLDPAGFLRARSASWTTATLEDARTRLAMFGGWLADLPAEQGGGAIPAEPWRTLPRRLRAGRVAAPRASWSMAEVRQLLSCDNIPPERRALYRCVALLGLRPVEASRIQAGHIVQQGGGWVLLLPAADQKARRADPISLTREQAEEILACLPLVRRSLAHFEEVFQRDLMRARLPIKQGSATRRLYDLRAFMISHLLREGVDLETVRQLARHRKIETTLRWYARHSDSHAGEVRASVFRAIQPKKARAQMSA